MRDYPLTFPLPLLPQSPYTLLHRPPSLLMDWYHYLSNFTTIFLLYLTPLPTLIIILRILMLYHYIIYNMYHYQYCDLCFFQGTPEGQSLTPINLHILKVNKQLENLLKKTFWRNFLYFDSINLDFSEPLASWRWDPWPKSLWDSQRSFKVGRLEIKLRATDDRILIATKGFKCCSNLLFFRNLDRLQLGGHVCAGHKVGYSIIRQGPHQNWEKNEWWNLTTP